MKAVRLLVAVTLVLFVASCGLKPVWDIAGKWQQIDGNMTIEFLHAGTVNLMDGNTSLTAKYKLIDTKHLEILLAGLATLPLEFKASEKELTLTNAKGETVRFERVK